MVRFAIIGCGARVQKFLLPALAGMPGIQVSALVDPQHEALEGARSALRDLRIATTHRLHVGRDDRALPSWQFDAAIIASPHAFHYGQARRCVLLGKPVLVEKPLACRFTQCARLFRYSSRPGVVVASPRWFRPDLNRVRQLVRAGAIGSLTTIRYQDAIAMAPGFAGSWRNDPQLAGGGVLLDLGCHTLHGLLRVVGSQAASSVLEHVALHSGRYRVETEASLMLRFAGTRVDLSLHLLEPGSIGFEELLLTGTSGRIRLYRAREQGQPTQVHLETEGATANEAVANGSDYELEDLRNLIRTGPSRSVASTATHSQVMRMIFGAYEKYRASVLPSDCRPKCAPIGRSATDHWAGQCL